MGRAPGSPLITIFYFFGWEGQKLKQYFIIIFLPEAKPGAQGLSEGSHLSDRSREALLPGEDGDQPNLLFLKRT